MEKKREAKAKLEQPSSSSNTKSGVHLRLLVVQHSLQQDMEKIGGNKGNSNLGEGRGISRFHLGDFGKFNLGIESM